MGVSDIEWRHTALLYYSSVVCVCFTVCMHYLFKILLKKKKANKLLTPFSKEPDLACLV